ncbi:beta-propeller domain-containing protein [Spongiactinospora sp. TRM90649]|uniref:beta-propeller domain-containing protein n=1 Tax=Spongiactinospora sp. TRM90649 TaxID=3031114 RepID=UPI0023F638A7|nr:beta-propeller domain-containing protein [Spongiactinospora sp. TRM90649]MDF5751436.1 beta-propeller domain-containing protein [Spongiactinospora sp. TRM90649]
MRTAGLIALLAAACAACSPGTTGSPSKPAAGEEAGTGTVALGNVRLVSYSNCDDMLNELRIKTERNVGPWGFGPVYRMDVRAVEDSAEKLSTQSSVGTGDSGYSTTNVHEAGVDEPDQVKTDGKRIITVSGGVLRVVDAATRKVTGSLSLTSKDMAYAPADLLLYGDRALVQFPSVPLTRFGGRATRPEAVGSRYVLVDLSGSTPKNLGTLTARGTHIDSRMVGSKVRLVVSSRPDIAVPEPPVDPSREPTDEERTERMRQAVREAPIEAWLPQYEVTGPDGKPQADQQAKQVDCEQVSHPDDYSGTTMLTVHTLDLAGPEPSLVPDRPISVTADGDTVYGTGKSLYVTSNPTWSMPIPIDPPPNVRENPSDPPTVSPSAPPTPTLTPFEPPVKSSEPVAPKVEPTIDEPSVSIGGDANGGVQPGVLPAKPVVPTSSSAPPGKTEIHRFDISADGPPRYVGSGAVPGVLLNQYSMSEHEGYLRIATTVMTGDKSESGVYVLDAGSLAQKGSVTGLGKTERIYAVRFIGPVGYVVTFRQTDPLYTLDLRDPAAPKVTGELKITGYSAYLHPAGDGLLIGVGQEASEEGRRLGTQVSLFDVSDPAAPRRLAQLLREKTDTEAEWDAHAFLYWPKTGMAVLPLTSHTRSEGPASEAMVLKIAESRISETGRVSHPKPKAKRGFAPVDENIRRSLVIGDTLWTMSGAGLKASNAATLADQGWVPFN